LGYPSGRSIYLVNDILLFMSVEFGFYLFANMKGYTSMRLNNGFPILINMKFHFDILQFPYSFEYITIFITQYLTTAWDWSNYWHNI
jgi:hypothetical protein